MFNPGTEKPLPTTSFTFSSSVIALMTAGIGSLPNRGTTFWAGAIKEVQIAMLSKPECKRRDFISIILNNE
jgi:hypothetical protein